MSIYPGRITLAGQDLLDMDFTHVQEEAYDALESDHFQNAIQFAWQPGQVIACHMLVEYGPQPLDEPVQLVPVVCEASAYHRYGVGPSHAMAMAFVLDQGLDGAHVNLWFRWDGVGMLDFVSADYVLRNGGS